MRASDEEEGSLHVKHTMYMNVNFVENESWAKKSIFNGTNYIYYIGLQIYR